MPKVYKTNNGRTHSIRCTIHRKAASKQNCLVLRRHEAVSISKLLRVYSCWSSFHFKTTSNLFMTNYPYTTRHDTTRCDTTRYDAHVRMCACAHVSMCYGSPLPIDRYPMATPSQLIAIRWQHPPNRSLSNGNTLPIDRYPIVTPSQSIISNGSPPRSIAIRWEPHSQSIAIKR